MRALIATAALLAALLGGPEGRAQSPPATPPPPLPPTVQQALRQAQLPAEALAVWLQPVEGGAPRLAWQADKPMNPASLMKLVTSLAALDRLGPAWSWQTPVWLLGHLAADTGVLEGDLVIKGQGDPKLTRERLWLLLQRLRALGLREIRGDIVLDGSAFAPWPQDPADFDGEPWRPGNAAPEALLLNHKAQLYLFRPDPARGVAWIGSDGPLAPAQASVPLLPRAACGDWRAALRLQWQAGQPLQFAGAYPAACGEQQWWLADPDPASHGARLLQAMWLETGGRLGGRARAGLAPAALAPRFLFPSPPLAEVLRDINKHSANVAAEMLLLSLVRDVQPASLEAARAQLALWLAQRLGETDFMLENGSGLARQGRLKARQLGRLLQGAWAEPWMPELLASLPLAGLDGTLARGGAARFGAAQGRAHLKTGSLRDVAALAGYVHADSGRRYVLVAMIQHPQAAGGRAVLDALLQWAAQDRP